MRGLRLTYPRAGEAALEPIDLPPLAPSEIRAETLFSGISRGTESLVFTGKVPEAEWSRMACPHQVGSFSFPISYGYSLVAKVIECGASIKNTLQGDIIFALHPHQNVIQIDESMANKVPDLVSPARACLAANMETALNAWWDGAASSDDRITVIGAGVVGLATAFVAQKNSAQPVEIVDVDECKREKAEALGLTFKTPDEASGERSLIFHTSASPAGLQSAIDLAAFEGRIIEMSWYGDKVVPLQLGGNFHAGRLTIQSSQVGHVSAARRATTTYQERMAEALSLLADPVLDNLLEPPISLKDMPNALPALFSSKSHALCQIIQYGD